MKHDYTGLCVVCGSSLPEPHPVSQKACSNGRRREHRRRRQEKTHAAIELYKPPKKRAVLAFDVTVIGPDGSRRRETRYFDPCAKQAFRISGPSDDGDS